MTCSPTAQIEWRSWSKRRSVVLTSLLASAISRTARVVYCCGPAGMIAAAEATSWRIGTSSLHIERFHPVRVPASVLAFGSPFSVRLDREDVVLEVPSDRSLLSVIRDVVPSYPSSCGSGSCGVCEAKVLSGRIDHRDRVLSLEECERGDVMMVCVSRGRRRPAGPRYLIATALAAQKEFGRWGRVRSSAACLPHVRLANRHDGTRCGTAGLAFAGVVASIAARIAASSIGSGAWRPPMPISATSIGSLIAACCRAFASASPLVCYAASRGFCASTRRVSAGSMTSST